MKKKSFIIIGAAGFLGSALSRYLRDKGYQVSEILRGQISGIDLDFNFLSKILKIPGKQVVIDFSYTSVPNTSFQDPVKDYSENLYNVIRHLEFVKRLSDPTYVYISSGGTVYGNPISNNPIKEYYPNSPLSPYGITKLCCEKYVLMYKEVYGMNTKIVRPSNIYGPGQKPFRGQGIITNAIAKIFQRETIKVFGNGDQIRDYLFIDDFCNALNDVIVYGDYDIYNIGSGLGFSINQIIAIVEKKLQVSAQVENLSHRPFDVLYNVLDTEKLNTLNHWNPQVSIEEGIDESIAWLKKFL